MSPQYKLSSDVMPTSSDAATDYALVRKAIQFITENWTAHPDLDELSRAIGVSSGHAQKLFKRWCGLSPKEFSQAIALDHAKDMLLNSASLLDTAHEVGMSGAGRLHDLFVTHEAMTPGEFKRRGEGLTISYGFHPSPFGTALVMATQRGVCGLAFIDEDGHSGRGQTPQEAFDDMARRWPAADFTLDAASTAAHAEAIFHSKDWKHDQPIRIVMIGTDFEVRVWQTLLKIPMGRAVTYSDIAHHLGKPGASRAVGSAVGRNPISFVIPCHRVIRTDGTLEAITGGLHVNGQFSDGNSAIWTTHRSSGAVG